MIIVTNETEFKNAISNMGAEIIVQNDISLTSQTSIGYAVTIRGEQGVSLFWAAPTAARRNMLIVTASGDLVIESLILDAEGRDGTLVQMNGGKFTMNDGAILRNVRGTTSQSAVKLGSVAVPSRATFIMNGGLITGIDSSDSVLCSGGTVIMNNAAAISDNMSAGITMANAGGVRSSLTMTGRSRISNNQSKQIASAGIIMGTDIIMGVNEGDAPAVTGNRDTVFAVGGWLLTDSSTLTMRYESEISDNHSTQFGGGLAVQSGSTISMYDKSVIKNNKTNGFGAGVILTTNSTIIMEDQSQIFGNVSGGRSGGLELQSGSVLKFKGSAAIHGNTAVNGAGIYLNVNTSASIGLDNSSPEIYGNKASGLGGGIYISTGSKLDLMGETNITSNIATEGSGIYKRGILNLSGSPQVLDGLFFNDLQANSAAVFPSAQPDDVPSVMKFQIPLGSPEHILIEPLVIAYTEANNGTWEKGVQSSFALLQPAYTDNVPIIADTLTSSAHIQLESSGYVSTPNVPLVIADKGVSYAQLGETDRAAWRIPTDFGQGYTVILNPELNQVLIDFETYGITYNDLFGAESPNPDSYCISDLPIILSDPGQRPGYEFAGWYDSDGQRVTEIPVGTAGGLTLTAVWEKLFLSFDGNARCVCNIPKKVAVGTDGKVKIPSIVPCRQDYSFICWNVPDSGTGKVYFPGDAILVSGSGMTLYAQWQPVCCRCHEKDEKDSAW